MSTADGRDKTVAVSRARLAHGGRKCRRAVLPPVKLAAWFAEAQLRAIIDGAMLVLSAGRLAHDAPVVGLGSVVRSRARSRAGSAAGSSRSSCSTRPQARPYRPKRRWRRWHCSVPPRRRHSNDVAIGWARKAQRGLFPRAVMSITNVVPQGARRRADARAGRRAWQRLARAVAYRVRRD
jgi:hypothetical protein